MVKQKTWETRIFSSKLAGSMHKRTDKASFQVEFDAASGSREQPKHWPEHNAILHCIEHKQLFWSNSSSTQASNHCGVVWVVRQDQYSGSAASDLLCLRHCQSWLVALVPVKSVVLNPMSCWPLQDWHWFSKSVRRSDSLLNHWSCCSYKALLGVLWSRFLASEAIWPSASSGDWNR